MSILLSLHTDSMLELPALAHRDAVAVDMD